MNEQYISNSEEKYKLIFENSPNLIVLMNLDGDIINCNNQCEKVTGFNKNEIIGKKLQDLTIFSPEYFSVVKQNLKKILECQIIEPHELKVYKKDGSSYWVYIIPSLFKLNEKLLIQIIVQDITALKKPDVNFKELLESERKYKNILENTKDAIVIVGLDGKLKFISPQLSKMIGRPIEINEDLFSKIHPSDVPHLKNIFFGSIGKKKALIVESIEFRTLHNDGYYIWLSCVSKNYYAESGEMVGFIVSLRDITEKKEAEQKLKDSEEKFRFLAELLPETIFELDTKGNLIYTNVTGLKTFGLSIEDFKKGIYAFDLFFSQKDVENAKRALGLALSGKFADPQEYSMKKKDGTKFYTRIHSRPIFKNEEVVGLRGIITDITEQKLGEIKLKESEEKYRLISENANDLIFILDIEGKYLYCNKTFYKILGYEPNELIGKSAIENVHPDDKKQAIIELKNALNVGYGMFSARSKCKDGIYKWLESLGNVTYDENGDPVKIFAVSRDISLRKEIEEKLKKSDEELKILNKELENKVKERTIELERKNIELEKLDKAKDNFLSTAAHELKTPLISIAGYTDYILTKYENQLQIDIKSDLSIVKKNIKRLHNLINLLLDATKLESHALKLNRVETNVSEIIYNCLNELNYLFKEKYQEMILNLDNEIILNVDPEKIFQIFSNLISNANKFTQKGGKIEINAIKQQNCYLFEVKDNGIGISKNNLNCIFSKFKTIDEENGEDFHQGTGLGLFISKGFVEVHGGKIWATSEGLNKGTTIHFTIPI